MQGITRAVRMTPELAAREAIPREASYVFAPADPLLMEYARSWSVAEPYVLRPQEQEAEDEQPGLEPGADRAFPGSGGGRSRRCDPAENARIARFLQR